MMRLMFLYFLEPYQILKLARLSKRTYIFVDPNKNKGLTREEIRLTMDTENIETRPLWKPMHQQPVFATSKNYLNGVSDKLFENGLCLPSGSNLTEEEFERIFNCLDAIFKTK